MALSAFHEPIALEAGSVHRIEDGLGSRVTCLAGNVWVTQAKDLRDILLASGQSFMLDRQGLSIVFALGGPALITVGQPAAAHHEVAVAEAA